MKIVHLRCEYQKKPTGIDVLRPRLSWDIETDQPGARQTAYQIQVLSDGEMIWDTGKIESDPSLFIEYTGPALTSRQRVMWKIRAWDENDAPTEWSEPAEWEMGLLERSDWAALWIGAPFVGGPRTTIPVPYLRKAFTLGGNVSCARLYIAALGVYEAYLNGQRIGKAELTPGQEDFNQCIRYQTCDITELLQPGENVIGAILGDGWYCGNIEGHGRQLYGDRPRLLAQLEMRLVDGSKMLIVSDRSWQTAFGPILESDPRMGESYDARLELGDWYLPSPFGGSPGGEGGLWLPVAIFPAPKDARLVAQYVPPGKYYEEITPIAITHQHPNRWFFDLGQGMIGHIRLKVKGAAGTTIRMRYAEALNPDSTIYSTTRATDYYTLKGDPQGEIWEPRFTFHSFRYVELTDYPGIPEDDTITGIVLHAENPVTGTVA